VYSRAFGPFVYNNIVDIICIYLVNLVEGFDSEKELLDVYVDQTDVRLLAAIVFQNQNFASSAQIEVSLR
jgi:hypothetical protein